MNTIERLEDALESRRAYLRTCNKVYFMADLETFTPEEEWPEDKEYFDDTRNLSDDDEQYMLLEPCNRKFHYSDAEELLFGLAEYLDKDTEGLDKYDVPLISYEVTDDNKLLFTCYVDNGIDLKSKPKEGCSCHKNLNVVQRLEKFLDGQIGDGWGSSGIYLYHFIGTPATVAYVRNLRQVKKVHDQYTLDYTWEPVIKKLLHK